MTEEEPKPIKVTKNEAESFQKSLDKKTTLNRLLEQYGLEERLLWDGLKEKYNIDVLKHSWTYNLVEKTIEVSHQNPSWAKDRLIK